MSDEERDAWEKERGVGREGLTSTKKFRRKQLLAAHQDELPGVFKQQWEDLQNFKDTRSVWQKAVDSHQFTVFTLLLIGANALVIGMDLEWNQSVSRGTDGSDNNWTLGWALFEKLIGPYNRRSLSEYAHVPTSAQ